MQKVLMPETMMVAEVCYVSSIFQCLLTDFKGVMFKSDLTDNFYLQYHIVMGLVR